MRLSAWEEVLFGRSAKFQFKSDKLSEVETRIPEVRDTLKSLSGLIECYIAWDESGAGLTMVVYDTQASADAALPAVQSIWPELSEYLEGPATLANYSNTHKLCG